MIQRMTLFSLGLVLVVGALPAQAVSGTISPNPAALGQPITITATAADYVQLPSSCVYTTIRSDSPTGTSVPTGVGCLAVITPLAPGQSLSQTWMPGPNVGTGSYWFQIDYWDVGFTSLRSEFFEVEIRHPSSLSPVLTQHTAASQGQDLVLSLGGQLFAGASYVCAASLTSNTGIPFSFRTLALDPDFVFDLSFPNPDPQLFSGFTGMLDANGLATGITISIPTTPVLDYRPLHVQAALAGGGAISFSNSLSFTVLP